MSVRPPQFFGSPSLQNGFSALEYEIAEERASALGRNGRQVEACLLKLRQWDAQHVGQDEARRLDLAQEAAEAVWGLFVQRELCGLSNGPDVVQDYQIPAEVMAKVGTFKRT